MIKSSLLALAFVMAFGSWDASAQTSTAPPPDQAPAAADQQSAPPATVGAPGPKPAKDIVAGCRNEAKAKGLKGDALRSAVIDCIQPQRPQLAQRLRCQQESKAQGLAGDALKSAVKSCVAAAKAQANPPQ